MDTKLFAAGTVPTKEEAQAWWESRLASECSASTAEEARSRAGEPVEIYLSRDLGYPCWAVSLEDGFWMEAFPTEEEAKAFVLALGWPLI